MNTLDMVIGALLFALGLWSGVFLSKRKPVEPPAKDKYDDYRDPQTGRLSSRMVRQRAKGESKGR